MATTTERDPRNDPQVGDIIFKISEKSGIRRTRHVVRRVNNDITYRDHNGNERVCWITSWMDWAREAEVEAAL